MILSRCAYLLEFDKDGFLDTSFLEIDPRRVDHILDDLRIYRTDVLV